MKFKFLVLFTVLSVLLAGCNSATDSNSDSKIPSETLITSDLSVSDESTSQKMNEETQKRVYPDNAYQPIDENYLTAEIAERGSVVRFTYQTRDNMNSEDTVYEKYALVYLPAGYDENDSDTRYNVMYFMHGGSDSPEWFLNDEGQESNFSYLFDYLIANDEMEPAIICFVSYYTEYCDDDTQNCINFHYELINDLIPAFESAYRTYAEDVTAEGISASRLHRAFGGFSMGAATTWSILENSLDSFAYFMPVSGDCWALGGTAGGSKSAETAEYLADAIKNSGYTAKDFYIYTGCGGNDIAEPNLRPQVESMTELSDTFILCDNFADGNLYFCFYKNGGHDRNTVLTIMYNGLPKMFG